MFILVFIFIILIYVSAAAADFDTLLSAEIKSSGVYDGDTGIFYAAEVENGTMLAVISAQDDGVIIKLFGSDNEPADTLVIKPKSRLSVSDTDDFFVYADKKYYRLVNDAFTLCSKPDTDFTRLAEYKNKSLKLYIFPGKVYDFLNELKKRRISRLPSNELSADDNSALLRLIRACADIQNYDQADHDIDSLMRGVLYTHRNFMLLSAVKPQTGAASEKLRICREEYIQDALYKAFRLTAPRPAVNMITNLGYCVNNGFYYYSGGYSKYYATDVKKIIKAFPIDAEALYIVFEDIYTEGIDSSREYSTAIARKDKEGWYLTSIRMNSDFSDLPIFANNAAGVKSVSDNRISTLLMIPVILLFAAAAAGITIYFFLLK